MNVAPRILQGIALLLGLATTSPQADPLKIGAWVGGPADEPVPQPTQDNVDSFQTMQGRKLDYISYFALWGESWANTSKYAKVAANNGSVLVITWMANGYGLDSINAGQADAYIRKYASGVKAYGKEVWLRPLHEANGSWYDWGVGKSGANNTNAKCVAAWQHIVQIFRDSSVTNVKWVWTTNATNDGSGTSLMGAYPGDDWVDYTSIDGYNWGTSQSWSSWQPFKAIFLPAYTLLAAHDKPIFIAEFSSSEQGGSKAQWIADMFAALPVTFPKIFALMPFSQTKSGEGEWALNSSEAALTAWKEGIATYASGIASGRLRNSEGLRRTSQGVSFTLSKPGTARLQVFSLSGQMLESRQLGHLKAGEHAANLTRTRQPCLVRLLRDGNVSSSILVPGL